MPLAVSLEYESNYLYLYVGAALGPAQAMHIATARVIENARSGQRDG